jgi:predicted metalloendopeptidase
MIENEQEAAVAILFGCLRHSGKPVYNHQVEHLSRMLLLNQKFSNANLQPMAEKAMPLLKTYGSRTVIEHSAPLITEGFKETLFAMVCELMTGDGELNEVESEIVGLTALYLGVSIELMRIMLATFIIRNRWNVQ